MHFKNNLIFVSFVIIYFKHSFYNLVSYIESIVLKEIDMKTILGTAMAVVFSSTALLPLHALAEGNLDGSNLIDRGSFITVADRDKDGIPNQLDKHPNIPSSTRARVDNDKDGIPNRVDKHPNIPSTAKARGDRDKDGIPNRVDKHPNIPSSKKPRADRDKDGIPNIVDKHPNIPSTARVGPDRDKDGVPNRADSHPSNPNRR
ncbi:hypothetical protein [Noviherbaspirillum malthae]|uniref:hypothetical protein n=1 Tax=Noviherbaspirillum malthae TaxID=1260987 RepID=UPI00189046E1|nr:hypothetical protein [Noviherbaspirillum malthae]